MNAFKIKRNKNAYGGSNCVEKWEFIKLKRKCYDKIKFDHFGPTDLLMFKILIYNSFDVTIITTTIIIKKKQEFLIKKKKKTKN